MAILNAPLTTAVGQRVVYAALGAVAVLALFQLGPGSYHSPDAALVTVAKLRAAGWAPASGAAPTIKDRPRGSRPVAVVQGAVRYPALEPGKAPDIGVDAAPPSRTPMSGADPLDAKCSLWDVTADISCRAEIIEIDGIPAARLFVAGSLQLGESVRDLPQRRLEDVRLEMAPIKRPRRFGWTVGVGGGYDPISKDARVVVGAMWGVRVR